MWSVFWRLFWDELTRTGVFPYNSSLFRVFVTALLWVFMILPLGLVCFATGTVISLLGKLLHFW